MATIGNTGNGDRPGQNAAATSATPAIFSLAACDWKIGQEMTLQQDPVKYAVRLMGWAEHRSILVSAPAVAGKLQPVRERQSFMVTTFSGRNSHTFTAQVLKLVSSPYPYLHLSYPRSVVTAAVRNSVRVNVDLVATLGVERTKGLFAIVLQDVSLGGAAGIIRDQAGMLGESVSLRFRVQVAGEDISMNLRAVIRSVTKDLVSGSYRHGFEFVNLDSRERMTLGAYLHEAAYGRK